jgi:hypothetical protein
LNQREGEKERAKARLAELKSVAKEKRIAKKSQVIVQTPERVKTKRKRSDEEAPTISPAHETQRFTKNRRKSYQMLPTSDEDMKSVRFSLAK